MTASDDAGVRRQPDAGGVSSTTRARRDLVHASTARRERDR